jgi:hypothetical protein
MLSRQVLSGRGTVHLFRSHQNRIPLFTQSKLFSGTARIMADTAPAQVVDGTTSGVTAESLREALSTRLGAQHVEIEDLSGMTMPKSGYIFGEPA